MDAAVRDLGTRLDSNIRIGTRRLIGSCNWNWGIWRWSCSSGISGRKGGSCRGPKFIGHIRRHRSVEIVPKWGSEL